MQADLKLKCVQVIKGMFDQGTHTQSSVSFLAGMFPNFTASASANHGALEKATSTSGFTLIPCFFFLHRDGREKGEESEEPWSGPVSMGWEWWVL